MDGIWDEERHGFAFTSLRRNWKQTQFRAFFATKAELHLSELYVVEPSDIAQTSSAEVASFSKEQMRLFDEIAREAEERPEWQREWWLPVMGEEDRPGRSVECADVRAAEGESASAAAERGNRAVRRVQ